MKDLLTTEQKIIRTCNIIKQLADGKLLRLHKTGRQIGMNEKLSIGFISNGSNEIVGDMTFAELNNLLDKDDVTFVIPEGVRT